MINGDKWIKAYDIEDDAYYTFKLSDITGFRHEVNRDGNDTYGVIIMVDVFKNDNVEIELDTEQYEALTKMFEIEELPGHDDALK